jgi:hypothetical protein
VLWVTKATRKVIWTFGRTYTRLGGRTLGGPPDIRSANRIGGRMRDHRTYATF